MEYLNINSLLFRFKEPEYVALEKFHEAKSEYYRRILTHFRVRNFLAEPNFVGDIEVYIPQPDEKCGNSTVAVYDRFCLKINFNENFQSPELIVSYERTMKVLKVSIFQLSEMATDDSLIPMVTKVLEDSAYDNQPEKRRLRLHSLKRMKEKAADKKAPAAINYKNLYPVVNRQLESFYHMPALNEDTTKNKNKYKRFILKIDSFVHTYLLTEDFMSILPLAKQYTEIQTGSIPSDAMQLRFANNYTNYIPQQGLNVGTYMSPVASDIILFFIYPKNYNTDKLKSLYNYLRQGYGQNPRFEGLKKYLGIDFHTVKNLSFSYDPNNPHEADEIAKTLARNPIFLEKSHSFVCCYLSPFSKQETDLQKHERYYQIKEVLLRRGIVSQCIDINKMQAQLNQDETRQTSNFTYSLQNMAVAICAKLGGSPWILQTPTRRDLIIGVGAFRKNKRQYIGAAFVFSNTGSFNQYAYFDKENVQLLSGAIREKITEYTALASVPSRLIIHYYKRMKREDALQLDQMLESLHLNIPVFIITVNETESQSEFVFEAPTPKYGEYMPYSGRYVSLGHNTFLLCCNTRYESSRFYAKDYSFPVKLYIQCTNPDALNYGNTIQELLQQVYQFSRIYWKSVRQQNLPVTILYPKMIAEIMPHFSQTGVTTNVPSNRLWFL